MLLSRSEVELPGSEATPAAFIALVFNPFPIVGCIQYYLYGPGMSHGSPSCVDWATSSPRAAG